MCIVRFMSTLGEFYTELGLLLGYLVGWDLTALQHNNAISCL